MTLRNMLYVLYIFIVIIILLVTRVFVGLMVLNQDTANIVMMSIFFSIITMLGINFFITKSILKVIFKLQEANKKNASGEFTTINVKTSIKEFSVLLEDYNQMVKKLEQQVIKIKQVEKEKSEIISNLSHDIKTPVSSLIGLGQALKDGILKEEEQEFYLQAILDNCYRVSDLSDKLFRVVESGKSVINVERTKIWIDELLIKILNIFKGEIDRTNREIIIVGSEIRNTIYSDESALFRIFSNIIDNSLKYSKEGTPIIIRVVEKKHSLEVRIQDKGQGIPNSEYENIFKRTYRIEKSRNRETGGYGLGLAINRQLLQHIGGEIYVESKIGVGSTFVVKIPYAYEG